MIFVACLITMTAFKAEVKAQNDQRIQASYLLAFGRLANSGELTYWNSQGKKSVQQLVDGHKTYIRSNMGSIGREVIIKSYVDALGYRPTEGEIKFHTQYPRTYTEMMNGHLVFVQGNPAEYEKVITRSYQMILGRKPSLDEIKYWKGQGIISYMILANNHQDWKNRNAALQAQAQPQAQPQAQSTALSTTAPLLAVASVSGDVLIEVKEASKGLSSSAGAVPTGGGNMVAAGGGNMVAAGGGNMVAAGGGNMVAAGGGN